MSKNITQDAQPMNKTFYEVSTNVIHLSGEIAQLGIPMQELLKKQTVEVSQKLPAEDNWTPIQGGYRFQKKNLWANSYYVPETLYKIAAALNKAKRGSSEDVKAEINEILGNIKDYNSDFVESKLQDHDIRAPAGYRFVCGVTEKDDRYHLNTFRLVKSQ